MPSAFGGERREVQGTAPEHGERHEAHVVADVPEEVGEAEQAGVAPAAVQALLVAHADEGAAGGAEDG